jgi:hypothetical protein
MEEKRQRARRDIAGLSNFIEGSKLIKNRMANKEDKNPAKPCDHKERCLKEINF